MRRAVVLALIVAFSRVAAQAALLHVHSYEDHDHAEHRHGLSAHGHAHDDDDRDDDEAWHQETDSRPHIESCEPASHVVASLFCATPGSLSEILVVRPHATLESPKPRPEPALVTIDARGHGPPPSPHRPLRAPPRQIPA